MSFDRTFLIENSKGDLIKVALSYYSAELISSISNDADVLTLDFYDVSLSREIGSGPVGYSLLNAVSKVLADFLLENENFVLCFLCDAINEVPLNRRQCLPQEFRSNLFSRMFERYVNNFGIGVLVNQRIEIHNQETIYAHFFCRKEHLEAVIKIQDVLLSKPIDE